MRPQRMMTPSPPPRKPMTVLQWDRAVSITLPQSLALKLATTLMLVLVLMVRTPPLTRLNPELRSLEAGTS